MSQGTQIRSPLGYRGLEKGVRYHVIHQDRVNSRMVLAYFTKKPRAAHLQYLSLMDFDRGRQSGLIQVLAGQEGASLPPWLEDRHAEAFDDDADGPLSDSRVMKARHAKVLAAAYEYEKIFSVLDPLPGLRKLARLCRTNEQRYVRNVITFLAFAQNPDVLRPPKSGRGTYAREKVAESGKRSGRPHRNGPGHGYDVTEDMKVLMLRGWRKFARQKRTLKTVWAKTLTYVFKCDFEERDQRTYIVQREGKPYPSYGQFGYWMLQLLEDGHKQLWTTLLGDQGYRTRFPVPLGSYHEGLRDLLEKVYSDATSLGVLPKSYFSDEASLALYEVPEYDALSGMVVGVAWGVGSESATLYNQARAITALPKSVLGELLGMDIRDEDFPTGGVLPRAGQTDQGAGAAKKIQALNRQLGLSHDITPAHTPQTNSPVEQSHGRTPEGSGAPTHEVSKLPPIGMIKQSLRRIMAENRSRDISDRLTPELLKLGIRTPLELWNYLRGKQRIQGPAVAPEEVIRAYVPEVTYTIRQGQLTCDGNVYRSEEFSETAVGKSIWKHEGMQLSGRAFGFSNRVQWVIVNKRVVKVKAVPKIQEHEEYFILGSHETEGHRRAVLDAKSTSKELRGAEAVRLEIEAQKDTGHQYGAAQTRKGRAPSRKRRGQAA